MLIGYARVSTGDQSLTLQIDALEEAGCERVFQGQVIGIQESEKKLRKRQYGAKTHCPTEHIPPRVVSTIISHIELQANFKCLL